MDNEAGSSDDRLLLKPLLLPVVLREQRPSLSKSNPPRLLHLPNPKKHVHVSYLQLILSRHGADVLCREEAGTRVFHGPAHGFGPGEACGVARAYPSGHGCR